MNKKMCKCSVGHRAISPSTYVCTRCGNILEFDFSQGALDRFLKPEKTPTRRNDA
jgi:hypothetical protein